MSVRRKDDKRRSEEECPSVADIESAIHGSGSITETEISAESEGTQRRGILHRVPPQVREKNKQFYDPSVVSLGPYHHGQPQVRPFEALKDEVLKIMLNSDVGADEDTKGHFRSKIWERVDEIRSFYGGLSRDEYNDEELAEMLVRDACMVVYFMELGNKEKITNHAIQSIGGLGLSLMTGDYYMLENQIPWWVIKLLISLKYDDDGGALICQFFSSVTFGDRGRLKQVPWEEGTKKEPLHLLEGLRTTSLKGGINSNTHHRISSSCPTFKFRRWWRKTCPTFKFRWRRRKSSQSRFYELIKRPFRSATELKAKGIYFRPSSEFLNDIRFSSYPFWGVLHLPVQVVNSPTMAFYSNLIVLETSPGNTTKEFAVTSYVNFMKSLIENPKDAKLLQENGILFNELEDNEQIVRMFKELDTHGLKDFFIFADIKMRINEHCDNKAKTWIAELINTYFRTPWTAIALFAATILLFLTLLQTYYTLNPRNIGH